MTWNSSCSIASDDENSRHSFLSDCGSEFDLRPPPRYPAEKRSYSPLKKQSINRMEPPMTRSRAKAIGKLIITSEALPKQQRRQSTLRRSIDAFTGMTTTLTNSLNNTSILFAKQEPTTSSNDRAPNFPSDGVNILADRFESCSLDEGKLNKNCVWPSRETNSHYTRPTTSPRQTNIFGMNLFSTLNNSTLFAQSSTTPTLFGQHQAQLWSRFRFAASTLRNNLWLEQTDSTLQQVPSNIFSTNFNNNNSFNFNNQSSMLLSPQTVPTTLMNLQNKTSSSLIEEPLSSSIFRQRKIPSTTDSILTKENFIVQQSSISKIFFTLTIFAIGLVLGYLLTNTLPPRLVWEICIKYFHILCVYLQNIMKYFASFRLA
ncbi:unnamed protein product [Rotaria sordida]|uniref:Uncharacterized protein n=1 Tax=Rotaria sordida TaxID=392033 RepID=A0A818VL47_9BILA|nr:unnamed protein product [Rotaria sordida]CAF1114712.1 unnamed protein product [Rotaria sordida]CAF3709063.1 unnamed protein product [Rotaria sordida]CAF3821593.1 unnamed protein product [Rotaria sordida]